MRQRLHRVEQLLDVAHADDAGAPQRRVEDVVGVDQRQRVGRGEGGGAAWDPPSLDGEDRLVSRGAARRRHEAAPLPQALEVEQDGPGVGIAAQVVEDLAEPDVGRIPERDEVRESDAPRVRPVEHQGADRVRLRDEADVARERPRPREAGVEPDARHEDAEGGAPQEPDAVAPGRSQRAPLERAALRVWQGAQAPGQHQGGPRSAGAELVDELRDGRGRSAEDRQVGDAREAGHVGVGEDACHRLVAGVDGHDGPVEATREEVAHDDVAHALGAVVGADDRDGTRAEHAVQVARAHAASRRMPYPLSARRTSSRAAAPRPWRRRTSRK